jgi:hypothetical protein
MRLFILNAISFFVGTFLYLPNAHCARPPSCPKPNLEMRRYFMVNNMHRQTGVPFRAKYYVHNAKNPWRVNYLRSNIPWGFLALSTTITDGNVPRIDLIRSDISKTGRVKKYTCYYRATAVEPEDHGQLVWDFELSYTRKLKAP